MVFTDDIASSFISGIEIGKTPNHAIVEHMKHLWFAATELREIDMQKPIVNFNNVINYK